MEWQTQNNWKKWQNYTYRFNILNLARHINFSTGQGILWQQELIILRLKQRLTEKAQDWLLFGAIQTCLVQIGIIFHWCISSTYRRSMLCSQNTRFSVQECGYHGIQFCWVEENKWWSNTIPHSMMALCMFSYTVKKALSMFMWRKF